MLLFLDTETTGLKFGKLKLLEVAWAYDDDAVQTLVLPHFLGPAAEATALEVNQYHHRELNNKTLWATEDQIQTFINTLYAHDKATLVGCNPRYDARVITEAFGLDHEPWSHRLLDIASYAAGTFGWETPKGMASLYKDLSERGYDIPQPDHSAAGDVEALRKIYQTCRDIHNSLSGAA